MRPAPRMPGSRTGACLAAICALLAVLPSAQTSAAAANAGSELTSTLSREQLLRAAIRGDTAKITGYQGRIDDLRAREAAVQSSVDDELSQLTALKARLRGSRAHLVKLRRLEALDRSVLARQLVAQYKAAHPSLVDVVLRARGFAELLDTVDTMRSVNRRNAEITGAVARARRATEVEARRLAFLTARRQRIASAVLSQRDQIARLRLTVVARQLAYVHTRSAKSARLSALVARATTLQRKLAALRATELSAGAAPTGGGVATGIGGDPGSYGFFPSAGTNYSVGDEPTLAARLDALGKALHLHLIGISGYRTPSHSIEVGGFANDPHTRGQASDTPGVEGVPEATLERFGLTRPFGGAAEANHIQLLGSA